MKTAALLFRFILILSIAGCDQRKQQGKSESEVKTPTPTAQTMAATPTPAAQAKPAAINEPVPEGITLKSENLTKDPNFANLPQSWGIRQSDQTTTASEDVTLPNGKPVKALAVTTNGDVQVFSSDVTVDPQKDYRMSIWFKKEANSAGSIWFGLYALNGELQTEAIAKNDGTKEGNAYFWLNNNLSDGEWHKLIGYVRAAATHDKWSYVQDHSGEEFRMNDTTKSIRMRFLSYYNAGTTTKSYFADPEIQEISISK